MTQYDLKIESMLVDVAITEHSYSIQNLNLSGDMTTYEEQIIYFKAGTAVANFNGKIILKAGPSKTSRVAEGMTAAEDAIIQVLGEELQDIVLKEWAKVEREKGLEI